jgi:N-acetylneuraminate lyase
MNPPLRGLIAAPFTPFHNDGSLALEVVPRLAALPAGNAVSGAFVCGTTGEGCSLTMDERRLVAVGFFEFASGAR